VRLAPFAAQQRIAQLHARRARRKRGGRREREGALPGIAKDSTRPFHASGFAAGSMPPCKTRARRVARPWSRRLEAMRGARAAQRRASDLRERRGRRVGADRDTARLQRRVDRAVGSAPACPEA
jgi:hypothetical protein